MELQRITFIGEIRRGSVTSAFEFEGAEFGFDFKGDYVRKSLLNFMPKLKSKTKSTLY